MATGTAAPSPPGPRGHLRRDAYTHVCSTWTSTKPELVGEDRRGTGGAPLVHFIRDLRKICCGPCHTKNTERLSGLPLTAQLVSNGVCSGIPCTGGKNRGQRPEAGIKSMTGGGEKQLRPKSKACGKEGPSQEPCADREGVPRACKPERGQRREAPRGPPTPPAH